MATGSVQIVEQQDTRWSSFLLTRVCCIAANCCCVYKNSPVLAHSVLPSSAAGRGFVTRSTTKVDSSATCYEGTNTGKTKTKHLFVQLKESASALWLKAEVSELLSHLKSLYSSPCPSCNVNDRFSSCMAGSGMFGVSGLVPPSLTA